LTLPRQSRDDPRPPNDLLVSGGGGTSTDKWSDVYQRLGSIQSQITYLEGYSDDARKELKAISTDIISAKATFKTLKIVFGVAGAICIAFWGLITTLVVMIAKHYLGW
jgi:cystathionine beta-lyase family protein involved in aluminum resistance